MPQPADQRYRDASGRYYMLSPDKVDKWLAANPGAVFDPKPASNPNALSEREIAATAQADGDSTSTESPEGGAGDGEKPLNRMNKSELEKTAADEGVDISSAANNQSRAEMIQAARDEKAAAAAAAGEALGT